MKKLISLIILMFVLTACSSGNEIDPTATIPPTETPTPFPPTPTPTDDRIADLNADTPKKGIQGLMTTIKYGQGDSLISNWLTKEMSTVFYLGYLFGASAGIDDPRPTLLWEIVEITDVTEDYPDIQAEGGEVARAIVDMTEDGQISCAEIILVSPIYTGDRWRAASMEDCPAEEMADADMGEGEGSLEISRVASSGNFWDLTYDPSIWLPADAFNGETVELLLLEDASCRFSYPIGTEWDAADDMRLDTVEICGNTWERKSFLWRGQVTGEVFSIEFDNGGSNYYGNFFMYYEKNGYQPLPKDCRQAGYDLINTLFEPPELADMGELAENWQENWAPCPGAPETQLFSGMYAYVSTDPPYANNVRWAPGKSNELVGQIQPGESMEILAGPSCGNGWVWWYVEELDTGLTGWTAEGDFSNYWLVPCDGPDVCP